MDMLTLSVLAVNQPRRPISWARAVFYPYTSGGGVLRTISAHAECLHEKMRELHDNQLMQDASLGDYDPALTCTFCRERLKPL